MTQPLFTYDEYSRTARPAAPAQSHSATSVEAATRIAPHLIGLQRAVLAYFLERGAEGATDNEMIDAIGRSPSTLRPRRIELAAMGLLKDSGATRPTAAGRRAVVWRAE